jgi:hypothetical protein
MSLVVRHFERIPLFLASFGGVPRRPLVLEIDVDHVLLEPIEVPSDRLDWFPREPLQ